MKAALTAFVVALMLAGNALAMFDINATKWSVRGNVDLDNVNSVNGEQLEEIYRAKANAYLSRERGDQSQGTVFLQGLTASQERIRFSVSWHHRFPAYGINVVQDDDLVTIIEAQARIITNRHVAYVPTTITYHKDTGSLDVVGPGFSITGINTVNIGP